MKALVIGGSGSIGAAITQRLIDDGYEVIVHYHRANLNDLTALYKNQPVQFVQADLSEAVDLEEKFGFINNLDALIYSSGASLYGLLQDMDEAQIEACYQINVKQLINLTQFFIDQLRQSDNGRLVVISSIWGETGASLETIYSTMKSAQLGFVKSLSQELALTEVTVNAITPGFVNGRMSAEFDEAALRNMVEELPQQRLIEPEEVAHVCSFLCHPLAKSITGTVQKVNGAWYV
ncbi:SDR family oxidoreductase [Staphylococcus sp. SQ8-PEA]|uniref:SDR family oxidoreductase n=1 Tax=Staphylococcus marylandisciuri TaxID=2981529 RepID=A0ABT2QS03_9STAP|nr:SDR family oxidoreductase [Staphylococcus marylandisciuri]MCU5746760.1 SDR family oxidoreductase [Staphylococcus marylandisciuri]